ncbi:hypothetical protein L1987_48547 [Smallanthus sonchifolius]|uniref:Uncharacterized protein n=1 Tax=Smallanthus sonchifolius TaxID=185202 RepID=A0ACB9FT56_9ASTR|nr:hypothetical protein L1987_48547 [Smallanthus sonchifolius]
MQTSASTTPKSTPGITNAQLKDVLKALDKGKYVPPSSTLHPKGSTEPDARDMKIQELEAKAEILEAQVDGLHGQIDILKKNDDFQLKACRDNAQTFKDLQSIV